MQTKTLIKLLFVLIILSVLYVLINKSTSTKNIQDKSSSFIKLSKSNISNIQIKNQSATLTLNKEKKIWVIKNKNYCKVNQESIEQKLIGIYNITTDNIVSKNKNNFKLYGIDTHAMSVAFSDNSNTETLIIGKSGPDYTSFYVKKKSKEVIYLTETPLRSWFPNENYYLDRKIYRTDRKAISQIKINSDSGVYIINKITDDTYTIQNNNSGKKNITVKDINPLLNIVANMQCNNFAEPDTITKNLLQKPILTYSVKASDKTFNVSIFKKDKNQSLCKLNNEPYIYLINKKLADNIKIQTSRIANIKK